MLPCQRNSIDRGRTIFLLNIRAVHANQTKYNVLLVQLRLVEKVTY